MPLHSDVEEFLRRLPADRKELEKMPLDKARDLMRLGRVGTSKEPIFSADLDCDGVPGRLYKPLSRVTGVDKVIKETGRVPDGLPSKDLGKTSETPATSKSEVDNADSETDDEERT